MLNFVCCIIHDHSIYYNCKEIFVDGFEYSSHHYSLEIEYIMLEKYNVIIILNQINAV